MHDLHVCLSCFWLPQPRRTSLSAKTRPARAEVEQEDAGSYNASTFIHVVHLLRPYSSVQMSVKPACGVQNRSVECGNAAAVQFIPVLSTSHFSFTSKTSPSFINTTGRSYYAWALGFYSTVSCAPTISQNFYSFFFFLNQNKVTRIKGVMFRSHWQAGLFVSCIWTSAGLC